MAKNSLTLGELDRERIAEINRRLGLKVDGSPLGANTADRIRIMAQASVNRRWRPAQLLRTHGLAVKSPPAGPQNW